LNELTEVAVEEGDWPLCPVCRAARSVRCPSCESIDCDWEVAADGRDVHALSMLTASARHLICPVCDEVFRLRLLPTCQTCGHRFPRPTSGNATIDQLIGERDHEDAAEDVAGSSHRRQRTIFKRMILATIGVAVLYTLYDWIVSTGGGTRLF
jgi:hypothetical protein